MASRGRGPTKAEYTAIAAFRRQLRHFLAFSEAAAAAVGLPPQQHQALLAIAGWDGEGEPTIGAIAQHLLIAPHTAAELIQRMAAADLLTKSPSASDRRKTELTLTPRAAKLLRQLTSAHVKELKMLEPALLRALARLARVRDRKGTMTQGARSRCAVLVAPLCH